MCARVFVVVHKIYEHDMHNVVLAFAVTLKSKSYLKIADIANVTELSLVHGEKEVFNHLQNVKVRV